MGLRDFADRLAGVEQRSISYQDVWAAGGSWDQVGGVSTSVEAALALPPLYAAVDIIAGQISAMPLSTYRKTGDIRERVPDGPLVTGPSDIWSPDEWRYVGIASMCLYGEAIGMITRIGTNGWPAAIEWVDPRRVQVERSADGAIRYLVNGDLVPTSSVVHIRHGVLTPGSLRGVSPVRMMPTLMSIGLEALVYERDWFGGGAHPSGILTLDVPMLTEEQADEVISRFVTKTRGRRPVAMSKMASYHPIQSNPATSGLEQTKRRVANDIANVYHIPPEMIGGNLGESLTYANLETHQQSLDLRALMPVYTRFERALSALMPRPTYVRFNADSQFRIDAKSRAEIAEMQLRSGQRTVNEVRAKDELGPIELAPGYVPPPPPVQPAVG